MSTYIESLILFILCAALYPAEKLTAYYITFILLIFTIYCFELVVESEKLLIWLGLLLLLLFIFIPELSIFLPMVCYIFFYRKCYLLPYLYILPLVIYLYQTVSYVNYLIFPLTGISFYFAYQSRSRKALRETIHRLRDSSVEQEMILRKNNSYLLASQNDQIYIATLRERNRIAREIHDSVGHMLSRSILQVGALLAICREESVKPYLEDLKETLNEAMNNTRSSVHDLHDEAIDLKDALTRLVNAFTFCPVQFNCEVSKQVPKEIKYCFISILKESFNNIIKHSNASMVSVTVKEHPAFYQLLIEDNGIAASRTLDIPYNGIGLISMKERVDALHGILHISAEHGFRIFVSIPKSDIPL